VRFSQVKVLQFDANGEPPPEIQPHQIVYAKEATRSPDAAAATCRARPL
jgi:hypothetical protein